MAGTPLSYGSFSLQQTQIITSSLDIYSAPERNVQVETLAQADGGIYVRSSLKPKTFTVSGRVLGVSPADCEALCDQLNLGLHLPQQNFDIQYAGATRRWIATPQNLIIARPQGLSTAGWSAQFICASPVGMDTTTSTLLSATSVTTSTATLPITVGGTYQAEPKITVTLSAVTGGTGKTVTITNSTTLRGVGITRNWSAGDVIEIDSTNKTIYVNSQVVNWNGQFPSWDLGAQNIGYLDDMTTRTASVTATYTRRWL